jgi:acyl-CoA thioesterase-1
MGVVTKFLLIAWLILFQAQSKTTTILVFGDSLTAGYGLSPEEAFPALVERQLIQAGKKVRVVNAGLSGETSAGGLARIDWILRQPVDIFVLELGGNDGLRGLPLDQTRNNLRDILKRVRSKNPNAKLVVAGMMVPPNMGPEYSAGFKNLYPDLAKEYGATLMPFLLDGVAGIESLNQGDGIHPNAEGHRIVAGNLTKLLAPLI